MITTMTGASQAMLVAANDAEALSRFEAALLRFQDAATKSAAAASGAIAQIGRAVSGFGGQAAEQAGQLAKWVNAAIDAQAKIDDLSQKLGLTAEATSKLSAAAKITGTDFDVVGRAMQKLSENATSAAGGAKANGAAFAALGIAVTGAGGQVKAGDQLLSEIAQKFSTYRDSAEKSALATKLFGDSGTAMIPMLNGGATALADYAKTAEQFGAVVGSDAAKASAQFASNIDTIKLAGDGLANTIAAEVAPALAELSGKVVEFLRSDTWHGFVETVGSVTRTVFDNLDRIAQGALLVGEAAAVALGVTYSGAVVKAAGNLAQLGAEVVKSAFAGQTFASLWVKAGGDIVSSTKASLSALQLMPTAIGVVSSWLVGWNIGKYLHENFLEARLAGLAFVEGMLVGWERIKEGGQILFEWLRYGFNLLTDFISTTAAALARKMASLFAKLPEAMGGAKVADELNVLANVLTPDVSAKDRRDQAVDVIEANTKKAIAAIREHTGSLAEYEIATQKSAEAAKQAAKAAGAHGDAQTRTAPVIRDAAAASDRNAKSLEASTQAAAAMQRTLESLSTGNAQLADKVARINDELAGVTPAQREHNAAMREANRLAAEALALGPPTEATQKLLAERLRLLEELREKQAQLDEKQVANSSQVANAVKKTTEATEKYAETVKKAMESGIDAIAKWAVNGFSKAREFWKGMVEIVKGAVAQIIAEWLKTRIVGHFFGGSGGGGALARAASVVVGGSGGSSSGGAVVDRIMSSGFESSAGKGGFTYNSTGSIFSAQSWIDAGKDLWSGFRQLWSGTPGAPGVAPYANPGFGYGPGAGSELGMVPDYAGGAPGTPGAPTYQMGTFGTIVGVAGGLYAGYNRWQNSNGGLAGGLGAAAYGIGTLGAAGVVGSVLGGTGAVAGMTGAMGAVGMIPVIGWIAAIAMLVDMVAGGKLFGTKARTQYTDSRIDLGAEGAEASLQITSVRQRSLFRGRQWSTREGEVTPEMTEAANKFWKQMAQIAKDVAKSIGGEIAPVIDASLRTVTEYDKKGREKATKYIVEALGRSWEEASAELATKRIAAEQMIASLDFNQKEAEASKIAERYRKEAEALADAAATMVQARADLNDGKGLLGGGDTLTSVMAWVEEQRKGDETLTATYARLSQATAQYNALVEQTAEALEQIRVGAGPVEQLRAALEQITKQTEATVKALNDAAIAAGLTAAREEDLAAVRELEKERVAKLVEGFWGGIDQQFEALTRSNTPAGDFVASMQAITQSLYDNIAQANMLARAQGLAGASTEQLARIHELAARQAATAISRLTDIGRNQVRSLYGGAFTLDQVNADIAALQSRANAASGAVQDFGGAMTDAANAASSAINLLLGDLSPLNDQEKLQHALAGLSAGTVSQEQVLEIGRRLYASSANYTALFNQVSAMGGAGAAAGGGGGGGGGGNNGPVAQPLSAEEQQKLKDLLLQRDELMKQQRINEARDLANTVAMLAAAQDESFEEVAKRLGLDLEKLAKDLGLKDLTALNAYLADIDVSTDPVVDSFTNNTDRLIATMDKYWAPKKDTGGATGGADDQKSDATNTDVRNEVRTGTETNERLARDNAVRLERIDTSIRELGRDIREAFSAPRSTRMTTV